MTPKILILVDGGVAHFQCATGPCVVHIVDLDDESPDPVKHETHEVTQPCTEEDFQTQLQENTAQDCAQCNKPVTDDDEEESTHCGSMHVACMEAHAEQCGVCRNDFRDRFGSRNF